MSTGQNEQSEPTTQEGSNITRSEAPPEQRSSGIVARYWYIFVILLLIFAVAGMYFWKNIAVSRTKGEVANKAAHVISQQNESYLRLTAIPLVWAVRSEMIRDNYDQINQYLALFVKEQNMKELVVAKADGKIVAATNKKLEGTDITSAFPADVLRANETSITHRENGEYLVVSPVMGLNMKLGVLVLVYAPAAFSIE
ncbi:MAG: hypothetical protein WC156_14995 [Pedobacter sp.]